MLSKEYYNILLDSIPADTGLRVERVVRGVAWTAAVLSDGSCGVGMRTSGESIPRRFETLEGLSLRHAAEALLSWNLEEASEGLAVVNAWYNHSENADALGARYTDSAIEDLALAGKTVGFVGHLVREGGSMHPALLAPAKDWFILEREPKPGDYPDSACEYRLPECDLVVITGSAAINKTMPRLLELAQNAEIVLTGPSVTLCPGLFALPGLRRLNASVITQRETMLEAIRQERRSINAFCRHCTLDRHAECD